jgi:hypothetical protein
LPKVLISGYDSFRVDCGLRSFVDAGAGRRSRAHFGHSRAELEPIGPANSGYSPTYADTPADKNVVARTSQGMICAGDVGPDEVRE